MQRTTGVESAVRNFWLVTCSLCLVLAGTSEAAKHKKDKNKHKSFHPIVAADVRDYAGHYEGVDPTDTIDIEVGSDGTLQVTVRIETTTTLLTDVQSKGAELTAVATGPDGSSKPFEATFVERDFNGERTFGMVVKRALELTEDMILQSIFYARR